MHPPLSADQVGSRLRPPALAATRARFERGGRAAISRQVYPDLDAFWSDLATAYRQAISHLYAAGCSYLQLDGRSRGRGLAILNPSPEPAPLQRRRHVTCVPAGT